MKFFNFAFILATATISAVNAKGLPAADAKNDPAMSVLVAQVASLQADHKALRAENDALVIKVASLEIKSKISDTTSFQGKKHVRRRLNQAAADILEDENATEDVEQQGAGIILSLVLAKLAKLEAVYKCVGYDSDVGGGEDACLFGSGNVDHVVIESNLDVEVRAHQDIFLGASEDIGIEAASSIDINATGSGSGSGDVNLDAADSIDIDATGNNGGSGDISIDAASDKGASLDITGYSISIDVVDSLDVSADNSGDGGSADGKIDLKATSGDVNIQGSAVNAALAPAANEARVSSSEDSSEDTETTSED